jgi:hypothetical protein
LVLRKPVDAAQWGDKFRVTPDDLQYLSTVLVDREVPLPVDELARVLMAHRWRQEQAAIEQAVSKGTLYRPKARYEVGESVVFPAFDYRVGVVAGVREGRNPEYGAFRVIQVDFGDGAIREFASELTVDHVLNDEADLPPVGSLPPGSADELMGQYGEQVIRALESSLEADERFVRLAGRWFRRDLLVEVNVGHLNLAEAVLDVAGGGPLPTEALLGDLELPEEITPQLRVFSLNYALQEDERFDEVGPAGEVLWFLRRLEPEGVRTVPPPLEYTPIQYDHSVLTSEMLALERELDDEWSDLQPPDDVQEPVVVVLTYPHWRAGTLPLSSRLSRVVPTGRTQRIHFTWVDADTGAEMPGWVVREARYVFGLLEWYRKHEVPVGAYLEVMRGERPGTVRVRRRARRPRREWVRTARAGDGRFTFEMRPCLIACEYDELMTIVEEDARALDQARARLAARRLSISQLVAEIFPELAKLSPQGTVHAATLYSAANFAARTPPGPLLAQLATAGTYAPMGDNYWVLRPPSTTL